jgi:hypothetical protein
MAGSWRHHADRPWSVKPSNRRDAGVLYRQRHEVLDGVGDEVWLPPGGASAQFMKMTPATPLPGDLARPNPAGCDPG